ncbi:LppX_LprAFG lipoprotein [Litorihabitans aurantiacus]|uniref:LppX_LprAFG lipoprotein n=1 Tax=Litorihabitans aurantiacus TaxID=1930061 RepID=A0AA37XCM4_9MICO|nr:LppX_LprAFG lipoprotein [Litorihabitans aurantiacus]GMA30090.1 hypothetical protein GCM10025875_00820 [Litorihabitans aurantiacus]
MRTSRTLLTIAAASALSLGLAACGSDSDEAAAPETTSSEASSSPSESASSDDTASDDVSQDAGSEATGDPSDFLDAYAQGLEDLTTASFSMTMDLMGQQTTSNGVLDYTTTPPSTEMTMDMMGQSLQMRMVDGVTYMNMGEMTQNMWAEMDPAMAGAAGAQSSDPVAQMRLLADAITGADLVGEEDVNGAPADRYSVTVDTTAMASGMGTDMGTAGLPDAITYDIWLDGEGRPVKTLMEMEVGGQATSTEIVLSNFGDDVTIEAPPADQITEMPGMGNVG